MNKKSNHIDIYKSNIKKPVFALNGSEIAYTLSYSVNTRTCTKNKVHTNKYFN